jgi:hypothetical protein
MLGVLDVVGSHALGCATEKNDLDILIDLPPKNRKNYFDYFFLVAKEKVKFTSISYYLKCK